jgi:hypothetical protein
MMIDEFGTVTEADRTSRSQSLKNCNCSPVIPAKAGIHPDCGQYELAGWIPAFAGMTGVHLMLF